MLRLHNTLTGRVEPFEARDGHAGLYVCGVTPYDTTHLGHARTYLVFDVLLRHLRRTVRAVRYVQNVTDVDESILRRARELGTDHRELGERYTQIYFEDLAALNMVPADAYPRATENVEEMLEAVERLVASGHAYEADGDVFFRVAALPGYGGLSGLSRERMLAEEAAQDGSTVDDPRKQDPLDFRLWRRTGEGEPSWPSRWGPGMPGWHIECTVLAMSHLGVPVDIHGGGDDLLFPHHEAEAAQGEALTGTRPFARFWMHVGMVRLDGAKMSKSDGNMVFVRDLLERHPADAIRLYLLSKPYRAPFDHDEAALEAAAALTSRLTRLAAGVPGAGESPEIVAALDDDLDTPAAVAALERMAARGEPDPALIACARDRLGLRLA